MKAIFKCPQCNNKTKLVYNMAFIVQDPDNEESIIYKIYLNSQCFPNEAGLFAKVKPEDRIGEPERIRKSNLFWKGYKNMLRRYNIHLDCLIDRSLPSKLMMIVNTIISFNNLQKYLIEYFIKYYT